MQTPAAQEAVRDFSDVVGRVRFSGAATTPHATLVKGGKPVARIVPASRLGTGAGLPACASNPNSRASHQRMRRRLSATSKPPPSTPAGRPRRQVGYPLY